MIERIAIERNWTLAPLSDRSHHLDRVLLGGTDARVPHFARHAAREHVRAVADAHGLKLPGYEGRSHSEAQQRSMSYLVGREGGAA